VNRFGVHAGDDIPHAFEVDVSVLAFLHLTSNEGIAPSILRGGESAELTTTSRATIASLDVVHGNTIGRSGHGTSWGIRFEV
jgi:hypothetical protein